MSSPQRVRIRREDGSWLDLTALPLPGGGTENRVLSVRIADDVDQAVMTATIELALNGAAGSLATMATDSPLNQLAGAYSPAVTAAREIVVDHADGEEFVGIADRAVASYRVERSGKITETLSVACRGKLALLLHTQIEAAEEVPGGPMLAVMQHVADRWTAPGRWPLVQEGDPAFGFDPHKPDAPQAVLEHLRDLAHIRGWSFRQRRPVGSGTFASVLFQVDRDFEPGVSVPRYTIHPAQVEDVSDYGPDWTAVRNRLRLVYFVDGERRELVWDDPASQARLGAPGEPLVLFGELVEGTESPIDTDEEATAYLTAAGKDYSLPGVEARKRVPYLWDVQVGDYVAFPAFGPVWGDTQYLAVKAFQNTTSVREDGTVERTTELSLRGRATGGLAEWAGSGGAIMETPQATIVVQEIRRGADSTTFGITHRSPLVAGVRVYRTVRLVPYTGYPWPTSTADLFLALTDEEEFTIPHPLLNHITFLQVEPVQANGDGGPIHQFQIFGTRGLTVTPDQPPVVHPPLAAPAWVNVAELAPGDCASGAPAINRLDWEGAGVVTYEDESGAWLRPPGAPASFDDPKPFDIPVLGGGYVVDEAGGTERTLRYRVTRRGVSGTAASTETTIVQRLRRCDGGGGAIAIAASVVTTEAACQVRDTLAWSVAGWSALMRVEYQLLDLPGGRARSGWLAAPEQLVEDGTGELTLDVHGGQRSAALEPVAPTDVLVHYGVRLRVVLKASGVVAALGDDLEVRYVVELCS